MVTIVNAITMAVGDKQTNSLSEKMGICDILSQDSNVGHVVVVAHGSIGEGIVAHTSFYIFKNGPFPASFPLFSSFQYTV